MDDRFSRPVRDILRAGGWFEGRTVSIDTIALPDEFVLFPKAEQVLLEFGELRFGESRRGVNCAASDIQIYPRAGGNLGSHIKRYEAVLQARLYPIGYVQGGRMIFTSHGRVPITLFNSASTRGGWISREEIGAFLSGCEIFLRKNRPDLVWERGQSVILSVLPFP